MEYTRLFLLTVFISMVGLTQNTHAQNICRIPQQGTFFIKGKALNVPKGKTFFELAVCHPFTNEGYNIDLKKDGSFEKQLPVMGTQDVYLYLGDAVTIFTYPGDTLELTFDFNDCPASILLKGTTEDRNKELQLNLELYRKFRKPFLDLNNMALQSRKQTIIRVDSTWIGATRQYIEDYKKTIEEFVALQGSIPHKKYLLQRGYFDALGFIAYDTNALNTLFYQLGTRCYSGKEAEEIPLYKNSYFDPFTSSQALSFMYSYLEYNIDRTNNLIIKFVQDHIFAPKMQIAEAAIKDPILRDWFCVCCYRMRTGYSNSSLKEDIKSAGEALEKKITDPFLKAELRNTINKVFEKLGKGKPAPNLTLTNDKGNPFSLKDLKGKIVYLDFWSDGCAPCIQQFKEQHKFHEKYQAYKDRIAYVYICVGSDTNHWKALVKKFGLKGINLHAQSWKDEAIAGYDVNAVPLYVLIDEQGNILEYNTLRPSEFAKENPNILDEALKASE